MTLTTKYHFNTQPEKLWPLLFGSKMDTNPPCFFLCGLPKPLECRLAEETGGVGKTRECVSDKGTIRQQITTWEPNERLEFQMKETNIYFGPCVDSIRESFVLQKIGENKTVITRKTDFHISGLARRFISIPMLVGLKSIHYYVFENWKRIWANRRTNLILQIHLYS